MMGTMRLISRGKAGPVPEPAFDDGLDQDVSTWLRYRRLAMRVLITGFVVAPAVGLLVSRGLTGSAAFLVPATAAFAVLTDRFVMVGFGQAGWLPRRIWAPLVIMAVLAAAMFAVG